MHRFGSKTRIDPITADEEKWSQVIMWEAEYFNVVQRTNSDI